ncbi:hypothetical protein HDZ31DRAFT_39237, partial [Schizophyllum fasciatum]
RALIEASPSLPYDSSLIECLYLNAYPESPEQRIIISALLAKGQKHLLELRADLGCMPTDPDSRLSEIKSFEAVCDVLRKATNPPIRRLSIDVLSDILSLCVEPAPDWNIPLEYSVPPNIASLLRITQVCRGWRQAVHDMPRLWQEFSLTLRSMAHSNSGDCITQWPVNAAELTLSYSIWADPRYVCRRGHNPPQDQSDHDQDDALCLRTVEDLLSSDTVFPAHRMQRLRLGLLSRHLPPALARLSPDAFPRLEFLHINCPDVFSKNGLRQPVVLATTVTAFSNARRLRRLHLTMFADETLGQRIQLPWSSLAELTLELRGRPEDFIAVLRLCPRLVTLRIDERRIAWHGIRDEVLAEPVTLDRLQTLRCTAHTSCHLALDAPNLATFHAEHIVWYSRFNAHRNTPFFSRANGIVALTLSCCDLSHVDVRFVPVLALLPRLRLLVLVRCTVSLSVVFEALTGGRGEQPTLVPCLQELRVVRSMPAGPRDPRVTAETFTAMIASRRGALPGLSRIQRIEVWPRPESMFAPNFDERVLEMLEGDVEVIFRKQVRWMLHVFVMLP